MFIGAINHKLRKFFSAHAARLLDGRQIYIGCSGNFTIEQIISRQCPGARIYSNDVALYSSVIGYALTGRDLEVKVREQGFEWLTPYLSRGFADKIAVFCLLTEMLKVEKQNSPYNVRIWSAYYDAWEKRLTATAEKVKRALDVIRIEDYTMKDVHDFYPRPGAVSIGFLPTYVGGYEKLYKRLGEIFEWKEPSYEMLTHERREATIRKMAEGDYILYDDNLRSDIPCVSKVEQFGKKAVYIYSNLPFSRAIYRRSQGEGSPKYRLLGLDEDIPEASAVEVLRVDNPTLHHYRNIFLKKGIETASGDICYLVFAGGRLFGFLIFKGYSKMGGDRGSVYLLSDFVVPSARHKRLAKLLLLVSLSVDMKRLLEEYAIKRIDTVLTTAFTDKPVSMKYRGIYELAKRGENDRGDKFLNYKGAFGEYTFKEVVRLWKEKFAKK